MGLLKKLQEANPDDGTPDGLGDGEFASTPEPASVTPSPTPEPAAGENREQAKEDEKEAVDAKKVGDDNPQSPEPEVVPAEVVKLELMLRGHDWWFSQSDDPAVRSSGAQSLARIEDQLRHCETHGLLEDARKVWDRYAPKDYPIPNIFVSKQFDPAPEAAPGLPARRPGEPFSDPYNRRLFNQANKSAAASATGNGPSAQQQTNPEMQYAGGGVQTDLLTKALSAPFAITAAAGSLILGGLRFAGEKARGFYAKGRENGHVILGQQLDEAAGNILKMTETLKMQGMGELIAEMKATGRPARELFEGMIPGGAHQNFGDRFSALMKNPGFAQQYARLEDALSDFGFKATHYAQVGIELNRDYSDAIERNVEKISAATEGFIFKKDGVVKHLQELARSISETVSNMINNLLGRHKPQ